MRKEIAGKRFDEERSLYNLTKADVLDCVFAGPADGESVLKEARDVYLENCDFSLRYPLWHVEKFHVHDSRMDELTRAAIWYAKDGKITDSDLGGIKAVRECRNITIQNCKINSTEFGWKCDGITLDDSAISSEYLILDSKNVRLHNVQMKGKYSFQYMENLTVIDSVVKGEYLGWFSEGLTLINCRIIGTQPLCYCKDLRLIGCTMEGTDLAFEYSDVEATVLGHVDSIKNPKSGEVLVDSVGEVIMEDAVMECTGKVVVRV